MNKVDTRSSSTPGWQKVCNLLHIAVLHSSVRCVLPDSAGNACCETKWLNDLVERKIIEQEERLNIVSTLYLFSRGYIFRASLLPVLKHNLENTCQRDHILDLANPWTIVFSKGRDLI
jgi:hypothetical protein